MIMYYQSCLWWLPKERYVYTSWGNTLLKGKDNTSINFMCLTMIDPAISWFDTIWLPTVTKLTVPNKGKGKKATYILIGDILLPVKVFFPDLSQKHKRNKIVSILVQMTWFSSC